MGESFPQAADLRALGSTLRAAIEDVARACPDARAYGPCVDALCRDTGPDAVAFSAALARTRDGRPLPRATEVDPERALAALRRAVRSVAGAALTRTTERERWGVWRGELLDFIAQARHAAGLSNATERTAREFNAARRARAVSLAATEGAGDNRTAVGAVVLGATVATLRGLAGWDQAELARRCAHEAIGARYIAQLERATVAPTYLGPVAQALGLPLAALVQLAERGHALTVAVAERGLEAPAESGNPCAAQALADLARFTTACVVVRERRATPPTCDAFVDLPPVARGGVLAVRRARAGLSEADVVRALGGAINERQLRQIERGSTRSGHLDALSLALGTSRAAVERHATVALDLAQHLARLGIPNGHAITGPSWTSTAVQVAGVEAVTGLVRFAAACVVLRSE